MYYLSAYTHKKAKTGIRNVIKRLCIEKYETYQNSGLIAFRDIVSIQSGGHTMLSLLLGNTSGTLARIHGQFLSNTIFNKVLNENTGAVRILRVSNFRVESHFIISNLTLYKTDLTDSMNCQTLTAATDHMAFQ